MPQRRRGARDRNTTSAGPIEFEIEGAHATRVVRTSGEAFQPTLPPHAELYMQPGGVRIESVISPGGSAVPVSVSLGEAQVTVQARLLDADEVPPDHHDYLHG